MPSNSSTRSRWTVLLKRSGESARRKSLEFTIYYHRIFDKTETGVITTEELGRVMSKFGENMKSSELLDMMKEADCTGNGKVDYRSKSPAVQVKPRLISVRKGQRQIK